MPQKLPTFKSAIDIPNVAFDQMFEPLRKVDERWTLFGVRSTQPDDRNLLQSPGISFEVLGNNTTALGNSYSDAVNIYAGAEPALPARELGSSGGSNDFCSGLGIPAEPSFRPERSV